MNSNKELIINLNSFNPVITPTINRITERSLSYVKVGYPLHFCGPSGTGKTTMAMYLAKLLNQPAVILHGDNEYKSIDLTGSQSGYKNKTVIDNFVHTVYKAEEEMEKQWVLGRLSLACMYGYTFIYDEFTRSKPETNNILLSVLEEKVLDLPVAIEGKQLIRVHPNFRIIFTSNPEEYAGVHKTQDALIDRMITIDVHHFDSVSEQNIVIGRTGLDQKSAEKIVSLVRKCREINSFVKTPTIRSSLMIANLVVQGNIDVNKTNKFFRYICYDILTMERYKNDNKVSKEKQQNIVSEVIFTLC